MIEYERDMLRSMSGAGPAARVTERRRDGGPSGEGYPAFRRWRAEIEAIMDTELDQILKLPDAEMIREYEAYRRRRHGWFACFITDLFT